MEVKYLQVIKKENIFKKIIKFFRKAFYRKTNTIEENVINIENKPEDNKKDFLNQIKIEQEDPNLLSIQEKYENGEIELSSLSDEEIHNLNLLYKRQIEDLKKKLDDKKTQLNFEKYKLKNEKQSFNS